MRVQIPTEKYPDAFSEAELWCFIDSIVGKYGHIGILHTRGSIYPKEYLVAIPGVCLLSQELISQTDKVRDKTEQTHQLCSKTRTPV